MNDTPPIIEAGIEPMISATFGINPRTIAYTAASLITRGSCTRLSSSTPVFSPYVVFAGPPNKAESEVARPSPIKVRWSPGSSMKFSPTVADIADISPTCSIMLAMAIGAMTSIAVRLNLGSWNGGRPTQAAEAVPAKLRMAEPSGLVKPQR